MNSIHDVCPALTFGIHAIDNGGTRSKSPNIVLGPKKTTGAQYALSIILYSGGDSNFSIVSNGFRRKKFWRFEKKNRVQRFIGSNSNDDGILSTEHSRTRILIEVIVHNFVHCVLHLSVFKYIESGRLLM